jgi:hypothetical protein
MKRLIAFIVAMAVGYAPAAFAAESLVTSGVRHVKEMAAADAAANSTPAAQRTEVQAAGPLAKVGVKPAAAAAAQQPGETLSRSGMSRGMKILLYTAIGIGVAASMYAIDHNVVDVTPSSLGTRQD